MAGSRFGHGRRGRSIDPQVVGIDAEDGCAEEDFDGVEAIDDGARFGGCFGDGWASGGREWPMMPGASAGGREAGNRDGGGKAGAWAADRQHGDQPRALPRPGARWGSRARATTKSRDRMNRNNRMGQPSRFGTRRCRERLLFFPAALGTERNETGDGRGSLLLGHRDHAIGGIGAEFAGERGGGGCADRIDVTSRRPAISGSRRRS